MKVDMKPVLGEEKNNGKPAKTISLKSTVTGSSSKNSLSNLSSSEGTGGSTGQGTARNNSLKSG